MSKTSLIVNNPANIYLFNINNRNTKKRCEICSKLTIKTSNDVSDVALVSLLLTLNKFYTLLFVSLTGKCLPGYQ